MNSVHYLYLQVIIFLTKIKAMLALARFHACSLRAVERYLTFEDLVYASGKPIEAFWNLDIRKTII
jgi:hypothetical protein